MQKKHGSSVDEQMVIDCNRLQGDLQLHRDYFCKNPTYPDFLFCQRFQMCISLFKRILKDVVTHNEYFLQKRNTAGKLGFSPFKKITSALRILCYGCSADSVDEYTQMGMLNHFFKLLFLIILFFSVLLINIF